MESKAVLTHCGRPRARLITELEDGTMVNYRTRPDGAIKRGMVTREATDIVRFTEVIKGVNGDRAEVEREIDKGGPFLMYDGLPDAELV